jgi:hypothetical protein
VDREVAREDARSMENGMLVECYERTRTKRLALDKEAAGFKEIEEAYKEELIYRMVQTNVGALASTSHVVKMKTVDKPTPKNWTLLQNFITETGAWELVQHRLSEAAIRERWEAGETVPGVEKFLVYSVNLSKL